MEKITTAKKAKVIIERARLHVIDEFIVAFNKKIDKGERHLNTGLDRITELNDTEFARVVCKLVRAGWKLTRYEDNYQSTTYQITEK